MILFVPSVDWALGEDPCTGLGTLMTLTGC